MFSFVSLELTTADSFIQALNSTLPRLYRSFSSLLAPSPADSVVLLTSARSEVQVDEGGGNCVTPKGL
jgi:hypothetical protein